MTNRHQPPVWRRINGRRINESWRVAPVSDWTIRSGGCMAHQCARPAAAGEVQSTWVLCTMHLEGLGMWIEAGRVVRWYSQRDTTPWSHD